ncbi:mediator of RNA polymerase II transcription subunit 15 [Anthonomus grandis grandis]|uniref:mediator of RNA polymerase II transcription subunit 15 n=1 Tax=Anthonomus grandis grandis TaxID=2921223 RepID=UPI0021664BE4|nr:mediator of RNA polymerase II transcription subunit 15 [Anthonomus grandis grandis]
MAGNMGEDAQWRTHAFRQNVVAKIEEAIRQSGMNTSRNSIEMENHVFQKAKNKDEYLGFVARLILHVREMNTKKGQPGQMGGVPGGGQQQQGPGMPDPINALQNLASQGSRNAMVGMGGPTQPGQMGGPGQPMPNMMQSMNRSVPQQIMMGGNMSMQGPHIQNMNIPPNSQMPGQIPMQLQQMGGQMGGGMQMQGPVGMQGPGQMGPGNMGQMGPGGMQGPMGGQMMGQMAQIQQQKPPNPGNAMFLNPSMMGGGACVRQGGPQMFAQSPLQGSAQSPAGAGLSQPPSASPALTPSPGAPMGMMGGPRAQCIASSPGASLNTPGQPGQSPMGAGGPMTDEQAYREKVRQLSKYIEPLRKMIAKMGNDDVEKMAKMKKLLEILSNPTQRMPLDTLIKCEIVLEKIDFKRGDSSVSTSAAPHLPFKEPHVFHSLLDAVAQNLQSPVINHTLHRTFGPTLDALFGPEFKLVPPLKKLKLEEPTSDIPDVLQGEIARLDQRFKVSLDPNQQPGAKSIQLTCWLDDKQLPCVPPISLIVPEEYPKESPTCQMASHEYNATKFLSDVQTALLARIKKLPKNFSVSQLLDTWEMSVRQAAAPSHAPGHTSFPLLVGI